MERKISIELVNPWSTNIPIEIRKVPKMKKSLKERVYDWSKWCYKHWIPVIPVVLGLICLMLVSYFKENIGETWTKKLIYESYTLELLGYFLGSLCRTVKKYNRETFMSNKIRLLLFADKAFLTCTGISVLIMIASVVKIKMKVTVMLSLICCTVSLLVQVVIKLISEHVRKKIKYSEKSGNDLNT